MKHLWEYDHPYYCGEATFWKFSDGSFPHSSWEAWGDFVEETLFVTGDPELNLLVRWDWKRWNDAALSEDFAPVPDQLLLAFVIQRKGYLCTAEINVTEDDEPAVRAYLESRAVTMRELWEPLLDEEQTE